MRTIAVLLAWIWLSAAGAAETLSVSFKTTSAGGNQSPKNIVAVWVETAGGAFVKTIGDWSNTRRSDLSQWRSKAGSSDTDAVMGATRSSHTATLTVSWDMTYRGGAAAADGSYKVWFETVDTDTGVAAGTTSRTGVNRFSFSFTKDGIPVATPQPVTDAAGKYTTITWTYSGRTLAVSTLTPSAGTTAGGTAVSITGSNFVSGATVTFGGTPATAVAVVNGTTITCTTPAHSAGAVDVVVTVAGLSGTKTGGFTYVAPPTVTAVAGNAGTNAGGTAVTISGSNFVSGATVTFGGTAATGVTVNSAISITCTTPAHAAGAVDVAVSVLGVSGSAASAFTYVAPPTVASVSPTGGTNAGGTAVTITGTNFVSGQTSVAFGGVTATGVAVTNSTTLTCITPAHGVAAVDVTVTVFGRTGTRTSAYTYAVPSGPSITAVTPNSGVPAGGTAVTITGSLFAGCTAVTFGGNPATSFSVVNDGMITCTTPAHAAGPADVVVTATAGTGTSAGGYTYVATPTVTGVSVTTGSTLGGRSVTVTGTNFVSGATVSFGGTAATGVTVNNATSITCITPAHTAGTVAVTVTVLSQSGSAAGAFTFVVPPTPTAVAASTGPIAGGTPVTITGSNFTAGASVDFGGNAATGVTVVDATTITCTTPAHAAGAVAVTVTVSGVAGTGSGLFTYVTPPTVAAVAYNAGTPAGHTVVTITGSNFVAGATVTFGGLPATGVSVANATTLTCTTPAHAAGAVNVVVTVAGVSGTGVGVYTYRAAPTVVAVSADSGSATGGTPVTVTGTDFAAGATVLFDGLPATAIAVVDASTITCTTPAHVVGAVNVVVTVAGQSGTGIAVYTYVAPPTVLAVAPGNGSVSGGTRVDIAGTGFTAGTTVTFGGAAATGVTVISATDLVCVTPAHAAGAVDVVATQSGLSGTAVAAFTYQASPPGAPTISAVSPANGQATGGTVVTISGTNFAAGATVSFGGAPATGVTVASATTITCLTPAHAAGAVDVAVTAGSTWTATRAFTYTGRAGIMYVGFTTSPAGGLYAPKHVLAAWIETAGGTFVKTIGDWSATRRQYLAQWNARTFGSDTDAVMGPTRMAHSPIANLSWDLRSKGSTTVVPDGAYELWIELADDNVAAGGTTSVPGARRTHVPFTIIAGSVMAAGPLSQDGFAAITIGSTPGAAAPVVAANAGKPTASCGSSGLYAVLFGVLLLATGLGRLRRRR